MWWRTRWRTLELALTCSKKITDFGSTLFTFWGLVEESWAGHSLDWNLSFGLRVWTVIATSQGLSGIEYCVCAQSCAPLRPLGLWPAGLLCPWDFPGKLLEWVAIFSSKRSSQPRDRICSRDRICLSFVSGFGRWILYRCTTWEPLKYGRKCKSIYNSTAHWYLHFLKRSFQFQARESKCLALYKAFISCL